MGATNRAQQTKAVDLILRGFSLERVAQDVGVSVRTVRRWRQDPEFQRELAEQRTLVAAELVDSLLMSARAAVMVLSRNLSHEAPGIRNRAAVALLAALPVLSDYLDQEQRLARLEAGLTDPADDCGTDR